MLLVSECSPRCPRTHRKPRRHTRDDYPMTDPSWGEVNLILHLEGQGLESEVAFARQPLPQMPTDLRGMFEEKH